MKVKLKGKSYNVFFGHSIHATANMYEYYIILVSKMLAMITEPLGSVYKTPKQIL